MTVNSLSIFGGDRTIQRNTFTDTDRLPAVRVRALIPDMITSSPTLNVAGLSSSNVNCVDYHAGSGQYIAVLAGGGAGVSNGSTQGTANYVYTSSDAKTWTQRTTPAAVGSPLVKRMNTNWVVFGPSACHTSPDGITWTSRTAPWVNAVVRSAAYNSTLNIGVCHTNSALYYTTDNGVTWTDSTAPASMGTPMMVCAFKGYLLLACKGAAGSGLYYSSNGSSWTACTMRNQLNNTIPFSATTSSCSAIEANSNIAVALSNDYANASSGVISFTSTDGINFTLQTVITADINQNPVYFTSDVSGQSAYGPTVALPIRAGSNAPNTSILNNYFRVINGRFALLGIVDARFAIFLSNDGVNWTTTQPFIATTDYQEDASTGYFSLSVMKDQLVITAVATGTSAHNSRWYATNPNAKELVYVL